MIGSYHYVAKCEDKLMHRSEHVQNVVGYSHGNFIIILTVNKIIPFTIIVKTVVPFANY